MNKEEFEKELTEYVKEHIQVKLTPQCWNIIQRFDDFPTRHWKQYMLTKLSVIGGGQLPEYLDRHFPPK